MSEVYLSNSTGRGLNDVIAPSGGSQGQARLTVLLPVQGTPQPNATLLYTFAAANGSTLYAIRTPGKVAAPAAARILPGWSGTPPGVVSGVAGGVVMAAAGAMVRFFTHALGSQNLVFIQQHALRVPPGFVPLSATLVAPTQQPAPAQRNTGAEAFGLPTVRLAHIYANESALYQQLWEVGSTGISELGPPTLLAAGMAPLSAGVAAVSSYSSTGINSSDAGGELRVVSVVLFETNGATLQMATAEVVLSAPAQQRQLHRNKPAAVRVDTRGAGWSHVQGTAPIVVGVGRTPSVSAAVSPSGDVVIACTYADAFCPNNEHQNKQTKVGSCDQTPKSTPGVLA